jgi:UDP-N-acetyl-D-galactosamine dehydrogenase
MEVQREYNIDMKSVDVLDKLESYSAVILAVPHKQFLEINVSKFKISQTIFYDLKGCFPKELSDGRL